MIQITTASAGSGKTYTLAQTYIRILLDKFEENPRSYRNILAVTFTNKATAEMKDRILKELYSRSKEDPRAKALLANLLHDYSAFAVSTIDTFFQHTLRAFSHEIGQFAQYQIELDRKSLIHESMDRILDSLTPDNRDVLDWLDGELSSALETGRSTKFEDVLYKMGENLKSENHRSLKESSGIVEDYSKERLTALRKACRSIVERFHEDVAKEAAELAPSLKKAYSVKGITAYTKKREVWETLEPPKKTLTAEAEGSPFMDLFDGPRFKLYNTAKLIEQHIFSLGLAGEFYAQFDALLKEKNIMCLDESNTILRDIIDGSDAPFVYEKLGVRFENFLLDEFQDTSDIQWSNFLPLLKESESKGADCLIVGDVKQSIYRFRESDWRLLDHVVPEAFTDKNISSLGSNWRSTRTIVGFNNDFFTRTAATMGLDRLYATVVQKVESKDPQGGQVRVSFTDDQDSAVLASVENALAAGAMPCDIAVLVRNNKEGAHIASCLIDAGHRVISEEALTIKNSPLVCRLVSVLRSIEKPTDTLSNYIAKDLGIEFPEAYHSLYELCQEILRSLYCAKAEMFDGETLFIQAFLDEVRKFTPKYGNDLHAFLKYWTENEKMYIASPSDKSAMRVLTIHKAKGLEFPYVIFPYAEKIPVFKDDTRWCELRSDGNGLPEEATGLYPVAMSSKTTDTLFEHSCLEERQMSRVDNLNVFYVALTRAEKVLHIISDIPAEKKDDFKTISQILFAYVGGLSEYTLGEPYDFTKMERKEEDDEVESFEGGFVSYPTNPDPEHPRLKSSVEAYDYFGEDGVGTSARLDGIALHAILSEVKVPSDLHEAVQNALREGAIDNAAEVEEFLSSRIALHPEWFPADAADVFNEVEMIDRHGNFCRPDRVVHTSDGRITVIDYKFGERRESYDKQVARYVQLYRDLGFNNVDGVVWYVRED